MSSARQIIANTRRTFPFKLSLAVVSTFGIYLAILSLSSDETNNGIGLLIATFAGMVAIFIFFSILRQDLDRSLLKLALIFFLLRLSIGVLHYLFFFDSNYFFVNYTDFAYLEEYMWLFDSMVILEELRL